MIYLIYLYPEMKWSTFPMELLFWIAALAYLSMGPMYSLHFSLCFFKWLGISWCPGCGLGHAISSLLHGDFYNSFRFHPLGLPALAIIVLRIMSLLRLETDKYLTGFIHTKLK